MQSGFKTQLLLYQTKYFTANLQITRVDPGSHFFSLTGHRTEKKTQKTKVPTPGRVN